MDSTGTKMVYGCQLTPTYSRFIFKHVHIIDIPHVDRTPEILYFLTS